MPGQARRDGFRRNPSGRPVWQHGIWPTASCCRDTSPHDPDPRPPRAVKCGGSARSEYPGSEALIIACALRARPFCRIPRGCREPCPLAELFDCPRPRRRLGKRYPGRTGCRQVCRHGGVGRHLALRLRARSEHGQDEDETAQLPDGQLHRIWTHLRPPASGTLLARVIAFMSLRSSMAWRSIPVMRASKPAPRASISASLRSAWSSLARVSGSELSC